MQLGTRWPVGSEPPASVPDELRAGIADAERVLGEQDPAAPPAMWTLTWLEGRPVATLPDGSSVTTGRPAQAALDADDEGWLA